MEHMYPLCKLWAKAKMAGSKTMTTNHPTQTISHEGMTAEVDEMIAPLILNLWKLGINTVLSCQDNPSSYLIGGWIWIVFTTEQDYEKFISIAAGEPNSIPESLYRRAMYGASSYGKCWEHESWDSDGSSEFRVSILFPQSDLQSVEANVEGCLNS